MARAAWRVHAYQITPVERYPRILYSAAGPLCETTEQAMLLGRAIWYQQAQEYCADRTVVVELQLRAAGEVRFETLLESLSGRLLWRVAPVYVGCPPGCVPQWLSELQELWLSDLQQMKL
jgi:hypothetical protein